MSDLETFANKFKAWRGDRRYRQYPEHFWDEIRNLVKHYPVAVIAQAININPSYLKFKLGAGKKRLKLIPLQITSAPFQASIEFTNHNCRPITVRFQANHEQLVNMILSLSDGVR
jgi:hypothetical protein